jgi:hypothetical protein
VVLQLYAQHLLYHPYHLTTDGVQITNDITMFFFLITSTFMIGSKLQHNTALELLCNPTAASSKESASESTGWKMHP